ncbi:MAG: DMT family transporter [Pseudomonadota bacterium]
MILGIGALTSMDALAKGIVQSGVSPVQILGLRMLLIVPAILLIYKARGRLHQLKPVRLKFQILRACVGFGAPFGFFLSLKYLPLSDAVITSYSSIMMITALSHFFLNERVGYHRWAAVLVGFIGVFIAVSPSGEGQLLGYFLVLFSAFCYAFLITTGRALSKTESVGSLVLMFNLCVGSIALCATPFVWQPMDFTTSFMVFALAVLALAGHFSLAFAISNSQTSVVAPFEYTSLIWAVLIEYFIWQYLPDTRTVVGGCVIIMAGLYVIYRESLNRSTRPLVQ